VLNQTPVRGARIDSAATTLGDGVDDLAGLLALPYMVMRNDHQDALGTGLAVTEYAPSGKSAEEIRGLWQWVAQRLSPAALADERGVIFHPAPDTVPTMFSRAQADEKLVAPNDGAGRPR
jgi:chromosome partitioning protein